MRQAVGSCYIQHCAGRACNRLVAAPVVMIPTGSMPNHTQQQPLRKKMRTAAEGAGLGKDNTIPAPAPSAVGTVKPAGGRLAEVRNSGHFRFWLEDRRFKGDSDCVQDALFGQGGVRTGGYPKAAPIPGPLGYQRATDWDLLWAPARLALKAVPGLKAGQLVSAMPGLMTLTRKRRLSMTLRSALGDAAWGIMPRSFALPDELVAFRNHIAATSKASNSTANGHVVGTAAEDHQEQQQHEKLWILKTAQHLGRGLTLLPASEAALKAGQPKVSEAAANGKKADPPKPYVVAQQYINNPHLIQGRKYGIRVWLLISGVNPLRAYLHSNGLVLFSTHGYDSSSWEGEAGSVALGHVTNYAQNMDGMVWNLDMLQKHLGPDAWEALWGRIQRSTALIAAAALKEVRADHAALNAPPESTFELLGLDYLVDCDLVPWLLEVNGTPSLAVDHSDPSVEALIREQKAGMARDMFALLNVGKRFSPRYEAMRVAQKQARLAAKQAPATKGGSSTGGAKMVKASKRQASALEEDDDDVEEQEEKSSDAEGEERGSGTPTPSAGAATRVPLAALDPNVLVGQAAGSGVQPQQDAAETEQVLLSKQQRLLRVRRKMLGRRKHAAASAVSSPATGDKADGEDLQGAADNHTDQQQQGLDGSGAAAENDSAGVPAVPASRNSKRAATAVDGQGTMVQLPRRLMEQLLPKSRSALLSRVQRELATRGGFIPLMHLFCKPAGSKDVGSPSSGSSPNKAGGVASSPGAASTPVLVLGRRRKTAVAVLGVDVQQPPAAAGSIEQAAGSSQDVEMAAPAAAPTAPAAAVDKQLLEALANVSFPWSDLDLECQELCAEAMRS